MAQVYKNVIFRNKIGFRRFWAQEPRHSENIRAEKCYLYRRTRHILLAVERGFNPKRREDGQFEIAVLLSG